MINLSHFRYATTSVGFGAAGASAATKASDNTAKISSLLATSVSGASSSSPFESASQDNISGSAKLAAQAAIARVQAQAKAKSEYITKQIDSVQKTVDDTNKDAKSKAPIIIGNTIIQPYQSWGSPPGTVTATDEHPVIVVGNTVIQKNYQSWVYSPPATTPDPTTDTTA